MARSSGEAPPPRGPAPTPSRVPLGPEQQFHRGSPAAPSLAPAPRCGAARGPSTMSSAVAGALELAGVRAEASGP
ncbi:hypothetical protein TRIUR3_13597 [Triticum urartu]|uniref:Uncharacterized protein n=1 Tax=Triticum urartu TaxID=4572 RepID=M7YCN9_TRIUA|nr:hypothetical protein TRIUR3_13597 [Triticum urartu]